MHAQFGQLLGKLVELSSHDIQEILVDQRSTHRRFGDIALAWGLCRPEHVWRAFVDQAAGDGLTVDLQEIGVDSQAASELPADLARQMTVIPIRSTGECLLVASAEPVDDAGIGQIRALSRKEPRFVRASAEQIREAIATYYADGAAT